MSSKEDKQPGVLGPLNEEDVPDKVTRSFLFEQDFPKDIILHVTEFQRLRSDDRESLLNYFEREKDLYVSLEHPRKYFPHFPFLEDAFTETSTKQRLRCPAEVVSGRTLLLALFSFTQRKIHYAMIPLNCKDIAWFSNT